VSKYNYIIHPKASCAGLICRTH